MFSLFDPSRYIPVDLKRYINSEILPRYDAFDKAHNRKHAIHVITESLTMAEHQSVNPSMVLVVAAYHDLGLCNGRENHHIDSGEILMNDPELRIWFTETQMLEMKEAIEDHRASNTRRPRSIYGMIIAEADRLIDKDVTLRRTVQYGLAKYPELSKEEQFQRFMRHLNEKYSEGGYLKLWIEPSHNTKKLAKLRALIDDPVLIRIAFDRIYKEETKK